MPKTKIQFRAAAGKHFANSEPSERRKMLADAVWIFGGTNCARQYTILAERQDKETPCLLLRALRKWFVRRDAASNRLIISAMHRLDYLPHYCAATPSERSAHRTQILRWLRYRAAGKTFALRALSGSWRMPFAAALNQDGDMVGYFVMRVGDIGCAEEELIDFAFCELTG